MNEPIGLIERARNLEDTAKRLAETNPVFHHKTISDLRYTAYTLRQQAKKTTCQRCGREQPAPFSPCPTCSQEAA